MLAFEGELFKDDQNAASVLFQRKYIVFMIGVAVVMIVVENPCWNSRNGYADLYIKTLRSKCSIHSVQYEQLKLL